MNQAQQTRLRTIDLLLDHYGTLNRVTLEDFFGISTPQASVDFATYLKVAPGNMAYDMSRKCYVKQPTFVRHFP